MTDTQLTLFRGWDAPTSYVWSPFVTKLEFRLRLATLPYKPAAGSPKSAPTGKIPYISLTTSSGVTKMGDSALITAHLASLSLLTDLNARLSASSRAHDAGLKALLEDRLYFFNMRERWLDPVNFYAQRDHVLHAVPYPIRVVIGAKIYRSHISTLHDLGVGRYSDAEVVAFQEEVWMALEDMLAESLAKADEKGLDGERRCFWCLGGTEPTECDTTVFGFVSSMLVATSSPRSRKFVVGLPSMMEYVNRIHETYFADYEKWEE
ncbi:hypothetical protein K402DRAFT_396905 [Aulographum hederae CBS 113979]|uniref:Thioredoxin-like fold domain-containing protein n=1 Tax=Aulographum hederae CBS 113979 TaxID=1176131 RepID=A0A6G1GR17_9PEZI|nr:hypothetical protein K402DRAFT_396905 [Aulographum hederae CBS 113979]